jgi:hypothetical protein
MRRNRSEQARQRQTGEKRPLTPKEQQIINDLTAYIKDKARSIIPQNVDITLLNSYDLKRRYRIVLPHSQKLWNKAVILKKDDIKKEAIQSSRKMHDARSLQQRVADENLHFSLRHLSNDELFRKLLALYRSSRRKIATQKQRTNQIKRALRTHSPEEIESLAKQVATFSDHQKNLAKNPILDILELYNFNQREINLRANLIHLINITVKIGWDKGLQKFLYSDLQKLQNKEEVLAFKNRVEAMSVDAEFTRA